MKLNRDRFWLGTAVLIAAGFTVPLVALLAAVYLSARLLQWMGVL